MKTLLLSTIVFLVAATAAFAGVQNGESADGSPHGNVTMNSSGGAHGDYKVTFTDDAGTSATTPGTPTMGGDPGEVEETGWVTIPGGGTYRVYNGRMQKLNESGDPVYCGPPIRDGVDGTMTGPGTDEEGVGSLPCTIFHVPVQTPTDKPKGDKPPKLEREPLPVV